MAAIPLELSETVYKPTVQGILSLSTSSYLGQRQVLRGQAEGEPAGQVERLPQEAAGQQGQECPLRHRPLRRHRQLQPQQLARQKQGMKHGEPGEY